MIEICPDAEILSNPAILTDKALQKAVLENVQKGEITEAIPKLSGSRKEMPLLRDAMQQLFSEAESESFDKMLKVSREEISHGRTSVGVEHFLHELFKQQSANGITSEGAKIWATVLDAELKKKGVNMPPTIRIMFSNNKSSNRNRRVVRKHITNKDPHRWHEGGRSRETDA